jgi:ribosomal protein L22
MADDETPKKPARTRKPAAKKPASATASAAASSSSEKPAGPRARAAAKKPATAEKPAATPARAVAKKPAAKRPAAKEAAVAKVAPTRARAGAKTPDAETKPTRARAAAKQPAGEPAAPPANAEVAEVAKPARTRAAAKKPAKPATPPPAPVRARARPARLVGPVTVRAQARYVRSSARKARLVCNHIRGKSVPEARALLGFAPRGVAADWAKLLDSAVANAEHNHELIGDELRVTQVYADEGPTLKRFRTRAMGRATPIHKRTSHLTIMLGTKE